MRSPACSGAGPDFTPITETGPFPGSSLAVLLPMYLGRFPRRPLDSGRRFPDKNQTYQFQGRRQTQDRAHLIRIEKREPQGVISFVSRTQESELVYMERSADVIKHKGCRVSASEVEGVLQDHPTVIGACVVGVPVPHGGNRKLKAW